MYVTYLIMDAWGKVENPGGEIEVSDWVSPFIKDEMRLSECLWIVPGTIDPND